MLGQGVRRVVGLPCTALALQVQIRRLHRGLVDVAIRLTLAHDRCQVGLGLRGRREPVDSCRPPVR